MSCAKTRSESNPTPCPMPRRGRRVAWLPVWVLGVLLASTVVAQEGEGTTITGATATPDGGGEAIELEPIPLPDLEGLESTVAEQLERLQANLVTAINSTDMDGHQLAENYGELARHYHAYDLRTAAAAAYRNAGRLVPGDVRWAHLLGHLHKTSGELAPAKENLERALAIRADDTPAMIYLGEIALAESRPADARAYFEAVLERAPTDLVARAMLAELDLAEGKYAEAVDIFEEVLATQPHANRFHYALAMAYRGLGRVEEARQQLELRGEVGLAPTDQLVGGLQSLKRGERVFLLRGRQAFKAGRYAEAAAAFSQAVEAEPESARARVNLGAAYSAGGLTEEAIAEFRKAIEIDPGNGTAHYNLARLLLSGGDGQGAYDHYQKALVANPRDIQSHLDLGMLLRSAGRPADAVGHFQKVTELDPSLEVGHLELATLLVDFQRYAEARDVLEKALALMPQAGQLTHALSRLLAASPDVSIRDGERAITLATSVWKAAPSVGHAQTLAWAYAQADRCTDAAAWARVALTQLDAETPAERRAALEAEIAHYESATDGCRPPS